MSCILVFEETAKCSTRWQSLKLQTRIIKDGGRGEAVPIRLGTSGLLWLWKRPWKKKSLTSVDIDTQCVSLAWPRNSNRTTKRVGSQLWEIRIFSNTDWEGQRASATGLLPEVCWPQARALGTITSPLLNNLVQGEAYGTFANIFPPCFFIHWTINWNVCNGMRERLSVNAGRLPNILNLKVHLVRSANCPPDPGVTLSTSHLESFRAFLGFSNFRPEASGWGNPQDSPPYLPEAHFLKTRLRTCPFTITHNGKVFPCGRRPGMSSGTMTPIFIFRLKQDNHLQWQNPAIRPRHSYAWCGTLAVQWEP